MTVHSTNAPLLTLQVYRVSPHFCRRKCAHDIDGVGGERFRSLPENQVFPSVTFILDFYQVQKNQSRLTACSKSDHCIQNSWLLIHQISFLWRLCLSPQNWLDWIFTAQYHILLQLASDLHFLVPPLPLSPQKTFLSVHLPLIMGVIYFVKSS